MLNYTGSNSPKILLLPRGGRLGWGLSQGTDYYPFGLEIQEVQVSDNLMLFNGKELQTDAKLWWYDYGARFYDPVLGRWHSVDPLAEKSRRWSPYAYCMDNPIRFIDPDGMGVDEFNVNKQTGEISKISNKGGNKTDYFNIGTTNEQGTFVTEKTLSIQRGTGSVNSFRFKEDAKGTISSFVVPQERKDITGFFLEPAGPSESMANINKRIPEGSFNLMKNDGPAYPNDFKLFNSHVSKDRGILMHIGNFNDNTTGCLLPGCGFGIGKIGQKGIETPEEIEPRAGFLRTNSSGPKLGEINSFIRQKGPENVKVNIFNIIDDEK